MKCPICGNATTFVSSGINVVEGYRRYRKCDKCGSNFISMETVIPMRRGRRRKMECEICKRELDSWYLIYKGKNFCRYNNDACLKNYLFDEADSLIKEDRANGLVEYDMSEVAENG